MTKEEKIKEAWGENYPPNGTDENGWSNDLVNYGTFDVKIYEFIGFLNDAKIRPRIIQGIENNNGWIKIESGEDLPKKGEYDMSSFTLYYWTNNGLYQSEDYKRCKLYYDNFQITHYRLEPIFKPKQPIY